MDVTDVLRDRHAGTGRPAADGCSVSLLLHGVADRGARLLAPRGLLIDGRPKRRATIMTITLGGGGDGPRTAALTSIGGRPVQVQTPPDEPTKREPVRPPAAKAPEMTVPLPSAKPLKAVGRRRSSRRPTRRAAGRRRAGAEDGRASRSRKQARAARDSGCRPAAVPAPARRSTSAISAAPTTWR